MLPAWFFAGMRKAMGTMKSLAPNIINLYCSTICGNSSDSANAGAVARTGNRRENDEIAYTSSSLMLIHLSGGNSRERYDAMRDFTAVVYALSYINISEKRINAKMAGH